MDCCEPIANLDRVFLDQIQNFFHDQLRTLLQFFYELNG